MYKVQLRMHFLFRRFFESMLRRKLKVPLRWYWADCVQPYSKLVVFLNQKEVVWFLDRVIGLMKLSRKYRVEVVCQVSQTISLMGRNFNTAIRRLVEPAEVVDLQSKIRARVFLSTIRIDWTQPLASLYPQMYEVRPFSEWDDDMLSRVALVGKEYSQGKTVNVSLVRTGSDLVIRSHFKTQKHQQSDLRETRIPLSFLEWDSNLPDWMKADSNILVNATSWQRGKFLEGKHPYVYLQDSEIALVFPGKRSKMNQGRVCWLNRDHFYNALRLVLYKPNSLPRPELHIRQEGSNCLVFRHNTGTNSVPRVTEFYCGPPYAALYMPENWRADVGLSRITLLPNISYALRFAEQLPDINEYVLILDATAGVDVRKLVEPSRVIGRKSADFDWGNGSPPGFSRVSITLQNKEVF